MKPIKFLILFSLGLCLFTACTEDDGIMDGSKNESRFKNPMAYVGDIHNHALDALATNDISIDDLCSFANSYVADEFPEISTLHSQINEISNKAQNVAMRIGIERSVSYRTRGESESETADSIYNEIPQNCKPFIDEMISIIKSNEIDSLVILNKFEELDYAIFASTTLSDEDKDGLWTCSSIAYSSYMYNLSSISSRAVTAEGVVSADLESAVGGFLTWRFWGKTATGLVFGPGGAVMCATREIVRCAIVGSGANIVKGLLW